MTVKIVGICGWRKFLKKNFFTNILFFCFYEFRDTNLVYVNDLKVRKIKQQNYKHQRGNTIGGF